MLKKFIIGVIVVFIALEVMDFILHGLLLKGLYMQSAAIWRKPEDMMHLMWVIYVSTFLSTIGFVYIYYKLIGNKSPFRGVWYGLTYGFAVGVGMGYSTYAMLPMPYGLAVSWFIGSIVEYGIAGWLAGLIIKEKA
ncbi:MAG: hypothetical protein ABSG15_08230 [FCB group bacterium]|jgi:hypothetical protein